MKTIKDMVINEIMIKNSKFITIIQNIDNENINQILKSVKDKYPKATHYCYAYIYNNKKQCSDDNEPSNTAGRPMLNVLEKEQLSNIAAVTIRYFGGIKLGAGGLLRAYTKSVTEVLKKANFITLVEGYKIKICFDYSSEKQINYLLEGNVLEKDYSQDVTYIALIKKEHLEKLHNFSYEILEKLYIENY